MRKMAEQSLKRYPRFQSIKATAENTTLKENSVDLVTVAQAFHWFDKEAFKIECQRILKQKANVALVWNSRDVTSPLIKENAEICQKTCPTFKGFSGGIDETQKYLTASLKMESMSLKNIKMIYFLIMKAFRKEFINILCPKENDEQHKNFIFLLSELFENTVRMEKLFSQT